MSTGRDSDSGTYRRPPPPTSWWAAPAVQQDRAVFAQAVTEAAARMAQRDALTYARVRGGGVVHHGWGEGKA